MSGSPVICFGQQPCGFFPRRFLYAKFQTARKLQQQIGGNIVFFYHDSDHDPRETKTTLRHLKTGEPFTLNFEFKNKIQRKFSPLSCKEIKEGWHFRTVSQIAPYVDSAWVDAFKNISANTIGDFCLEMWRAMGLLEGFTVVRSSDPAFRAAACGISDFFVDVPHEGEIVRARFENDCLKLHEGGESFITLPLVPFTKEQISPARDTRLRWMQSVVNCSHYVAGAGEQAYLRREDAPEIVYINRDPIERSDEAFTDFPA